MELLSSVWTKWVEMAPWLTIGLLAAGLMQTIFPARLVHRWLGGEGLFPCLLAALIGTPLPLCSCSVLPAAIQLRRSGASRGATVSFLIATPENGADSIMMSWGLLGPWMTLLRVIGALISSVVAGGLTSLLESRKSEEQPTGLSVSSQHPPIEMSPSCCGTLPHEAVVAQTPRVLLPVISEPPRFSEPLLRSETSAALPTELVSPQTPPTQPACCATNTGPAGECNGTTWQSGIRYAVTKLLRDISGWLVLGVITAALIDRFVPPNAMVEWGRGPLVLILVLLVSIPTYVCATASTPIAASLLSAGMSPGAVLVFLLAGPATNFSSAAIIRRELGSRSLIGYLSGVVGITLMLGLLVDWLIPTLNFQSTQTAPHMHSGGIFGVVSQVLAVALAIRMLWLFFQDQRK